MEQQYYAQVIDGIVHNVVKGNPKGRFDPKIVWIPCNSNTKIGDYFNRPTKTFSEAKLTLEEEKQITLNVIEKYYVKKSDAMTEGYSPNEMISWFAQIEEARMLLAGADPKECYFLQQIANRRRIDIYQQAKRIIANNVGYRVGMGALTGDRLYYEDLVKACETIEALNDVRNKISYWMQEGGIK